MAPSTERSSRSAASCSPACCSSRSNTFSAMSLSGHQLDLTANRQYTLSKGTTKLLGQLPEPVTLRLYVSKAMRDTNPFLASYADRVRDLLQTYAQRSQGKLQVETIDPEPFSPGRGPRRRLRAAAGHPR